MVPARKIRMSFGRAAEFMRPHMRYLLTGLLSLALVAAFATGAAARAYLDHAQPADGAEPATPPTAVKLRFSRAIEPSFSKVRVVDAQGKQMDDGKATVSDNEPKLIQLGLTPLPSGNIRSFGALSPATATRPG
jgi:methionine-rich copper-binding protein CopC